MQTQTTRVPLRLRCGKHIGGRLPGWPLLLLCLALLTGCGQKSPEAQLQPDVESALSWTATLRFASEAWLRGKVSTPYYKSLLEDAEPEIRSCAGNLNASHLATHEQKQAFNHASRVARYIGQLRKSPAFPSEESVKQFDTQLAPEESGLRELKTQLEAAA